jgi:hypothetical protein
MRRWLYAVYVEASMLAVGEAVAVLALNPNYSRSAIIQVIGTTVAIATSA